MENKLIKFYKSILKTGGFDVDEENRLTLKGTLVLMDYDKEGSNPVMLPTKEVLRNPEYNNHPKFHPLSENILVEETPVHVKFRTMLNYNINKSYLTLMALLIDIGNDNALTAKINPSDEELVQLLADVDNKSADYLNKLIMYMGNTQTLLFNLYIKRSGKIKDTVYSRLAVITSPIIKYMNEVKEDGLYFAHDDVKGVKLRVKDIRLFKNLLNYLTPQCFEDVKGVMTYNVGSNSNIAPTLEATLKSIVPLVALYNDKLDVVKEVKGDDIEPLEGEWLNVLPLLDTVLYKEACAIPLQFSGTENDEASISEDKIKRLDNFYSTDNKPKETSVLKSPAPVRSIPEPTNREVVSFSKRESNLLREQQERNSRQYHGLGAPVRNNYTIPDNSEPLIIDAPNGHIEIGSSPISRPVTNYRVNSLNIGINDRVGSIRRELPFANRDNRGQPPIRRGGTIYDDVGVTDSYASRLANFYNRR